MGTATLYDSFWDDLMKGNVVPSSDTYKMMLCTNAYTPSKASHAKRSDVTNEVSGTGYTAGGVTTTCTITAASGNSDKETLAFSNGVWSSSTITARYAVIYKSRGGAASADNLVGWIDFGSDVTDTNGTFTVTLSTPYGVQN